jgi:hypothetical protein
MDIKHLLEIFSTSAQVALILNILLLMARYHQIPTIIKRIAPFIILTLIIEVYSTYLTKNNRPNLFLLHIYTLMEFIAWAFFYQLLFRSHKRFQQIFPYFITIISFLIIANTVFIEPLSGFNSNAKSTVQIIFITLAIVYFFQTFGRIDLTQSTPRSLILINFAIILYYSGSLFIFMFSKLLNNNNVAQPQQYGLWTINALLYFIFLILLFLSIWIVAFRPMKS